MSEKPLVKPRFQVEKLEGTRTRTVLDYDKEGNRIETETEVEAGWMVYVPSGISFRVTSLEELERLELINAPELVDMNSGDVVGTTEVHDLKRVAEHKSARSTNQRANVGPKGSLTAN